MNSRVVIGEEGKAELCRAILIYLVNSNPGRHLATVHDVEKRPSGPPRLCAGRAVDARFVRELSESLKIQATPEFLPENVLAKTGDAIVWWTPAKRRRMFFSGEVAKDEALKALSGKMFAHPPLLWVVKDRELDLYALKTSGQFRPRANSPVYVAPYWNTGGDGGDVCQGSMRSPRKHSVDSMAFWEKAYFESEFTHTTGGKRLSRHPGGMSGLWQEMAAADVFNSEYLVRKKTTVAQIIGRL